MRVLVMGLPGSGKTTLSEHLSDYLGAVHINADFVRNCFNDHDFSMHGRMRQASRMRALCDLALRLSPIVLGDFVCPTPKSRDLFQADFTIWMDTIGASRFPDTDGIFVAPSRYDIRVVEFPQPEQVAGIAWTVAREAFSKRSRHSPLDTPVVCS